MLVENFVVYLAESSSILNDIQIMIQFLLSPCVHTFGLSCLY